MSSNHHNDEVFRQKRIVKNPIKFKIPLNEEQKEAKEKILHNTLTLLADKAGSGKTLLACQVAQNLQKKMVSTGYCGVFYVISMLKILISMNYQLVA